MQGLEKVKCVSCGTMFMSETDTKKCPTCSEGGSHDDQGSTDSCGCGHGH